ncbi:hypothetical protein IFR05_004306 [Cadophora sp. M221]|nr:hypothetical protein IFR05_004306 [Cadophora sp. M221]
MIWKYSARQPRVVETSLYQGVISTYHATHTLVPGIMHTCTESRAIGLEFYEEFGHYGRIFAKGDFWRTTYINFEIETLLDTLFLNGTETYMLKPVRSQSERMIVEHQEDVPTDDRDDAFGDLDMSDDESSSWDFNDGDDDQNKARDGVRVSDAQFAADIQAHLDRGEDV